MIGSRTLLASLAPLLLASLVACTEGDGDVDDLPALVIETCPQQGRYMALRTGATWSYRVDDGEITAKTQTVGALEAMSGAKEGETAFRLTTTKPGGQTISWQEDTGTAIVRHRELDQGGSNQADELYMPYRTRVDEAPAHLVAGATWTEAYTEVVTDSDDVTTRADKTETWLVEAVDQPLAVPAGDFCTLRLKRTSMIGSQVGSVKTYWFARGVGKIKESGDSQTEVLVSYQ